MAVIGAFILPHPPIIMNEVGQGKELMIKNTIDAYNKAAKQIACLSPDTIIIISPHSTMYSNYFCVYSQKNAVGDLWKFGGEKVKVEVTYNTDFVKELSKEAEIMKIHAGTRGNKDEDLDHGVVIPLAFVNKYYKNYKTVRMGLSGFSLLEHYNYGELISKVADKLNEKVVIIASGDLSHTLKESGPYGFCEEGVEFDKCVIQAMQEANFLKFMAIPKNIEENAAECGLKSFLIMAGTLDKKSVETDFMSYEDTFGVGYAVCSYKVTGEDASRNFGEKYETLAAEKIKEIKQEEGEYVKLARLSLESYIIMGEIIKLPQGLSEELLKKKAGVFVCIKKFGELRGCIGTITAVHENIAQEIISNAISAGVSDYRFDEIKKSELEDLVYTVDVLGECEEIDSAAMLDVIKYGVVVNSGNKRGLLLPNLDGVDTVEQQIEIALAKADINKNEEYKLQRFEVIRYI